MSVLKHKAISGIKNGLQILTSWASGSTVSYYDNPCPFALPIRFRAGGNGDGCGRFCEYLQRPWYCCCCYPTKGTLISLLTIFWVNVGFGALTMIVMSLIAPARWNVLPRASHGCRFAGSFSEFLNLRSWYLASSLVGTLIIF